VSAPAILPGEVFELEELDLTVTPDDAPPLRCQSDGCTNGVVKPARGKTPAYCPDHRASASRPTSSRSKASGKSWPKSAEVEKHLTDSLVLMGKGISFLNEIDGVIVQTNGPAVIHELVELAKDDKTLQRYLLWLASPGKYGPLLMACSSLILPILANHNFFAIFQSHDDENGGE
jgi:hypothetical protein